MKKWSKDRVVRAIARAKRSALGRTMCRLCGDTAGGVMMEYVILGVLVAAAAVTLVVLFGDRIANSLGIMTKAVSGDVTGAVSDAETARDDASTDVSEANTEHNKFHN